MAGCCNNGETEHTDKRAAKRRDERCSEKSEDAECVMSAHSSTEVKAARTLAELKGKFRCD